MKRYFVLLLFLILTFTISCIILGLLITTKKEFTPKENKNLQEIERLKLTFYTKQLLQESVVNDGEILNLLDKDILNQNNEIFISDKPRLVYRYSALNCSSCIEFGKSKLEEHFPNFENDDDLLFIISDYPINKKVSYTNCLNLNKNNLGLSIELGNQPFYFLLINNQVEHVFIPDKSFAEYTDIYLQKIRKRYFEN